MQVVEALIEWINIHWVTIIVISHISLSFPTSLHVLLFKENERTSLAWIGLVIFSPVVGSLCYWLFGINRIKRLAQKKHTKTLKQGFQHQQKTIVFHHLPQNWHPAIISGYAIHPVNLVANNRVEPLINGDTAYPAMIQSIDCAKHYIILSSYIFDYDSLGHQFVNALAKAHQRGVIVNVLLDGIGIGIGIGYSWHKSDRALKKRGVPTARFLPAISFTGIRFINLRNHRKILSIDGDVAYIGGMNISKNNLVKSAVHPIDDIHFKVTGPVINQISQVFIKDWFFATGKLIQFPRFDPNKAEQTNGHSVVARVIQDGPDEFHNRIRWTLINALVCAQTSVKIITPYFIPDQTLMTSLHAAALRGVSVEIIVPEHSNILFVDWVMEANFSRIMANGIRIYKNKRPFDHSKMVIVDDIWSFIGSTNWDARSLEFNFEINLECFDTKLNTELTDLFALKKQNSERVIKDEIDALPIYKKFVITFSVYFPPIYNAIW